MHTITTRGNIMPALGFGTYRMTGAVCQQAVESALALGYRHIDTAQMYGNEDAVGAAIEASGVARGDIQLTTKVWWQNLAPDAMRKAMAESLEKLRTPYVDLYLIHWPAPEMDVPAAMETLMALQAEGLARRIGVANFTIALLRQALEEVKAPLMCNQVEYHVLIDQTKLHGYMQSQNLPLVAYAPLAQGRLAEHPALGEIAKKHNATPAQVALKWLLDQKDVAAIPKASRPESQQSNLDALKVTLDDEDRAAIAGLPKDQRFVKPAFHPEWD